MVIIGLIGEQGSGKGTAVIFLKEIAATDGKKAVHLRFSDILKEALEIWNMPLTRENFQKLAVVMARGFGADVLTKVMHHRILALESTGIDIVMVDGVRWETDVKMLRGLRHNVLFYVTSGRMERFGRIRERNEKVGETEITLNQFLKQERAPTEKYIPKLGNRADYTFFNNSTLEGFRMAVKYFYDYYLRPML